MIDYDSPKFLGTFLSQRGLALKKRFGQNFLINPDVRKRILLTLNPGPGDLIWEIGPGLGCMSQPILASGARLRAFEIDRGFLEVLKEEFGQGGHFFLTGGDVLETWRDYREEKPHKLFGNLPYASAAAIIADFLEEGFLPELGLFMVQKEVAQRMTASPGTREYSSFSLLCRSFVRVRSLFDVAPGSFYPAPEVVSSLVELRPREPALAIRDRRLYLDLLRALFASRRKTIRNNLLHFAVARGRGRDWTAQLLAESGLDPGRRAETLDAEDLLDLVEVASDSFSPGER